jgi:DNA-binding response OmpR family regulator
VARILVVDDNARLRDVLRDILTQAGYEVETAGDGKEACQTLKRISVDLLITDIVMPEKEGIETITTVRRNYPGVRIIAMSGDGSNNAAFYLEMAREFGADMTLSKPFGRAQILEAVEGLIGVKDPR